MVSLFGPQNQASYGLSVAQQNRREDGDNAGHTSRSSDLLRVKANRTRIFQSDLKTGGGATRIVHVVSSWKLRRDQVEDRWVDATDCVGPCYAYFTIFILLCPRDILVFCLCL
jgi:hypothetical protein